MKKKNNLFSFSRRERFGSTLLIFTFSIIWVLPQFLPRLFPPPPLPGFPVEQKLVHLLMPDSAKQQADTLFFFDPNTAGVQTLVLLGIPEKTAQTIERYRQKGGLFRKKEDFAKIYGLAEEDYLRLEPFIQIPPTKPRYPDREHSTFPAQGSPEWQGPKKTDQQIDINRANVEEWQTLRGIGPGYAKRIVKFRDMLGGFSSVAQVGETFGLPDSVYQKIESQLALSPVYRMLNVNTAPEEELALHPYLSDRQARTLALYRQNHGPFAGVEDLKKIRAIPDTTIQKLLPYLSYERPE